MSQRSRRSRANSLVLVTAILVLLVIIATAFLVRSQGGRTQAAASQALAGRQSRSESIALDLAQEVADALFVKRIDRDRMAAQVTANQQSGLGGNPRLGEFVARSDFPRRPAEPLSVRYGVDYFDFFDNRTLGPDPLGNPAAATEDGFLDGYNFAPFSVNPFTNWPDRYGDVPGEQNPVGNPGFGDSRWLASTEPVRARVMLQHEFPIAPAPPAERDSPTFQQDWSNLALRPWSGGSGTIHTAMLDPAGLGFSHWPHLSWIATAENGFRVAWNIASLEGYAPNQGSDFLGAEPGVLTGVVGSAQGELALGVPYEQWLPWMAPREAALLGKDPQSGYLLLNAVDWRQRVREWFNVGSGLPGTHYQIITGAPDRRASALPNFLQLSAFGTPADEFGVYTRQDQAAGTIPQGYGIGSPKPRNLISRTLADADGDGWTDSFWFLAPTSSDRGTRQLVAARIIDNSALINVNIASRSDRNNTIGQTPSDVALVTRRESYDETQGAATENAALRDPLVGFFNARENDPEYRANFSFVTPFLDGSLNPSPGSAAKLVYAVSTNGGGSQPTGGVDVSWAPDRWEGRQEQLPATTSPNAADPYRPSFLSALGLVTEGAPGQVNAALPLFNAAAEFVPDGSAALYGERFILSRPADRINYFKAMSMNGEVIDPVTASRVTTLTPFSSDDEVELRAASGLNSPQVVSRLENALNASRPLQAGEIEYGQFLRSSRSREETSRFFGPSDVRSQDWRARSVWTADPIGNEVSPAARSGAELLLDHRRLMTTVSGARNDILPPRLWSIRDHRNHGATVADSDFRDPDVTTALPAFVRRGIDRSGPTGRPDGLPDDLTGDGVVTLEDDLPPYHPNVMFTNGDHPLIPPNPALNPYSFPIRDARKDGVINVRDFEVARQRFLYDNRKIDLRQPVDLVRPGATAGTIRPATPSERLGAKLAQITDTQRLLRRALTDELSRQSYFGQPNDSSDAAGDSLATTKLMAASLATNIQTWRDGPEPIASSASADVSTKPRFDSPFHPSDAPPLPSDVGLDGAVPGANSGNMKFIGVEKQPFIMEVFLAFVYPKSKLKQSDIDRVVGTGTSPTSDGCPPPSACTIDDDNPFPLPGCAAQGAGENFVVYEPTDPDTQPAVVFAVQIANPYNEPINLGDFEIRVNPATGNSHYFRFRDKGRGDPTNFSGNQYGEDVQLGPCTPEEPRTAIVFSIPGTFPDGRPFPRDAWLDFLDLRQSIDLSDGTTPPDGTISDAEGDPSDDTPPGRFFPPDVNALFRPAWGDLATVALNGRGGTLIFDATSVPAPSGSTQPILTGFDISGDPARWKPPAEVTNAPPNNKSFIELNRVILPVVSPGSQPPPPVWVTVDRFDNHLDTNLDEESGQRFSDIVNRMFSNAQGGSMPPRKGPNWIRCDNAGSLYIDGIRLRTNEYYVTWARSARQWLFDTENGRDGDLPGRGRITLDERTPRWVFARQTGTMSSAHPTKGAPDQQCFVGGIASERRGHVSAPTTHPDAPDGAQNLPIFAQYVNMWGEPCRGKPTFFPTRIPETRIQDRGTERSYAYPAWGVLDGDLPAGTKLSYGEKGVTDERFVDGANPDNFVAPLRMFQKDGDFDQVAEVLDVPMWGPLVYAPPGTTPNVRAIATLPEILAQPADSSANVKFPKFPKSSLGDGELPAHGPDPASLNRLAITPAQYGASVGSGGRASLISGVQAMPPSVPPGAGATAPKQQGGIGFSSSLVAGAALLDAFTLDDRGAGTLLDATTDYSTADGLISFEERAKAEDRRFRLAGGFGGKLTPGLININTAPIEVLRAMPQMLRLTYDDDFPILAGQLSDPAQLETATAASSELGRRRRIREPSLSETNLLSLWDVPAQGPWADGPEPGSTFGWPGPGNPASILFDYGTPAPRVRIAESIELWRNKGNVRPDFSDVQQFANEFTEMPSYFSRGVDLPAALNHRGWAPDSRGERGFDSIGELALLTKGAQFGLAGPDDLERIAARTVPDVNRNNVDDRADQEANVGSSWNQAMSWSIRYAGQDPFRTQWARDDWGAGWRSRYLAGIPGEPDAADPLQKFTDGVPRYASGGAAFIQQFPLTGRTAIDKHLITVAKDDRTTALVVETNDPSNDNLILDTTDPIDDPYLERRTYRYDRTAGDVIEQNQLLKGISNIATTRSDVFTVWLRIRTIKQDRLTGQWNGTDPSLIVDDSRYLMTIDRSSVDRPGERPRIINFVKVPN